MKKSLLLLLILILSMFTVSVSAMDMFDPDDMISAYNSCIDSFCDSFMDGANEKYTDKFSLSESYSKSSDNFAVYTTGDNSSKISFANDGKTITIIMDLDSSYGNVPSMIFSWALINENYVSNFDMLEWMNGDFYESAPSVFEGDGFIVSAGLFKQDSLVITIIKN